MTLAVALVAGTASVAGIAPAGAEAPLAAPRSAAAAGEGAEAAVSEDEALAEARRTGRNVEVTSARGESRDVFATPEGRFEAREYMRPVRTRAGGAWVPVDTTLAVTAGGAVGPKAVSGGLSFSGGGEGPLVRMERAGRTLEFTWPGDVPKPTLEGDTATYADILPDVDLRLGAHEDGFTQLLVVRSAEAAGSPALAELRMGLAADGMTVRETAEGGLAAVDDGAGTPVFEAAKPMMWDSSPGATPAAGAARSAAQETAAATGDEPGAGESGQLAPVGVEVAAGGEELVLTPDQEVLAGDGTVYPVFIDPQWYSPKTSAWTMASEYWASSPQWKFNGDPDAGLGYCGWAYCKPYDTKRLFYQIPTSQFAGKSILSAEFVVRETHAASCDKREVQLWRTKGINSSTTWNTQKASGFWVDHIETRSFAYGYDGCSAADAEFDVKGVVAQAAAGKWPSLTFGMRATSESDMYTWKRFSDDAFLRVNYNRPPGQIKTSQLTQDPGGACGKPGAPKRVRTLPTMRANDVTDPDKDRVRVQFEASWDSGDGKGFTSRWTSAASTYKASGSDFSLSLPSTLPKNRTVGWSARSNDGAQWSPWSWAGSATACNTVYDTSVPAGPSITSAQYPASDPEDPQDPWLDGVGRYGTFTVDSTSTDVSKYWFGINGDPSSAHTLTTSGGGAKTMKFMPTRPGVNFITAQAFDTAGNGSEIRTYQFRVRAGQPDRLTWDLDEPAGATGAAGEGGAWPAALAGGAQPGVEGVSGQGLRLDGVDDHGATVSPVLNTGKSFSVSLWAKLPTDKRDAATVAVSQAGHSTSGFEVYHSTALGGWVFLRHSVDAEGSTSVRAVQPACPAGDTACVSGRLGVWTHLVGVFDNPAQQLKLYVDGQQVGTAPFTAPWDARGSTLLGAASHYGTLSNFFQGDLDEVQLFDYQLSQDQVARLHSKQPVNTNRPAKLAWPLDEDSTATAVTGRAQPVTATLKGGATSGAAGVDGKGLELDGVDDHATSGRPLLDTYQSFAVSAWARLPKNKPSRAMVVAHQSGAANRGFELYHTSTGWVFQRATADTSDAPLVRALENATSDPKCPVAPLGEWAHVVGVYDIDAQQIRLYVNGCLKGTQPFTTPWLASGPLTLGASGYPSGVANFFQGNLDDVRLYDRTVTDDEVRQLFKQRPLVKSRWLLDSATGTPAASPNAVGGAPALTLGGQAAVGPGWVDDAALFLDGVDDYASTTGVPVDTGASYTVTAWAQAAAAPGRPATVISAEGATRSAFAVRYAPAADPAAGPGSWQIQIPGADSAAATTVTVDNHQFYDPTEWNHLALVYDGFADQVQLYVNGQLEQVACADADADGSPDDATCGDQVSWASNTPAFTATKSLQFGRSKAGSTVGDHWSGGIDDVWTFQGALTESQIAHLSLGMPGVATEVPGTD
ncbi:LamG-like jellyroll fold domain-containing protein [Streptomyces sp. NBC_00059]|uniref:LamG-like jellyroll fold domain-containing protein n=1 Tax=Streptomyces sp. NBC_00059 TaxID=2975635 RepID=UPI002B1D54B7|nr:LamG-like jellyroll fold domain-containing protein [Streptomyces sp. NBC_00059]